MAGWTGPEPAASGVTGAKMGFVDPSSELQASENYRLSGVGPVQRFHGFGEKCRSFAAPVLQGLDGRPAHLRSLDGGQERLLTVKEVAARLGVCRATAYELCERGELPHIRGAERHPGTAGGRRGVRDGAPPTRMSARQRHRGMAGAIE